MTTNILFRQKVTTGSNPLSRVHGWNTCANIIVTVMLAGILCQPARVLADTCCAIEQLASFAQSRPSAGAIMLVDGQEVYPFLIKAFSGAYTSVPLAWDPAEPNDNSYAEHAQSDDKKIIKIRVSSKLSALDQVAALVYESLNAQNEEKFTRLIEAAHLGTISKSEFILGILRLEHQSLKKNRAFLEDLGPFKNRDLSQTIFYSKMSGTPEDFDAFIEYLHRIKRKEFDIFENYANFYDFVIPPTRKWKANQIKAVAKKPVNTPATNKNSP